MWNFRGRFLRWAHTLRPAFLSRNPHFNFISLHYFWIIGWTILGSILIYAGGHGNMAYIDALAFAAGANTQAGLNTIDLNLLNTFQQLVIYFCTLLSNPITIHSSVVFLRLYWFEKRFHHVAHEARLRRSTLGKSRSKGKPDAADAERGIDPRDINVVHATGKSARMTNDAILLDNSPPVSAGPVSDPHSSSVTGARGYFDHNSPGHGSPSDPPHIKFASQVRRGDRLENNNDEPPIPVPGWISNAEHIAILEKQRKAGRSVLRIPGPRDAEMGALPEEFEDTEGVSGGAPGEEPDSPQRRRKSSMDRPQVGYRQPTITIAEPHKPLRDDSDASPHSEGVPTTPTHIFGALKLPRRWRFHWSDTSNSLPGPLRRIRTVLTQNEEDPMPYLSWQPTIGRNSEFEFLTEEQREELGGIEYRSLKILALILVIYFWGCAIFGIVTLVPWIVHNNPFYGSIVDGESINRVWWGFWTSNSAFMDLGFTLTPNSMLSFNAATFPLLVMSVLIILGNTGFPVALRFMIWVASLIAPRGSGLWEELRFLLDHPRRCFTLLFPANANWLLFATLVAFNGIDLLLFVVLDLNYGAVSDLPLNVRFLDGWFQATSTRTAGFSCVDVSKLHPAVQVSYLVMMYIAIFPVAMSIRQTNVYEEKSLGLYTDPEYETDDGTQPSISYLSTHLRRQLSFDLWYVFFGFFLLSITESQRIRTGDISMFAILFELVSAYGTVGVSLGYPGTNTSLVAQFTVTGKLIIIAMMIRGRHRGLPYGLDRAVLLPSENLNRSEAEDAELRLQRRVSAMSAPTTNRRPSSMRRMSEDRSNLLTQFLHIGPAYSIPAMEHHRADHTSGPNGPDTLRRHTSTASAISTSGSHDQATEAYMRRRAEAQSTSAP
ncbi:cation transport protein-domain-containing protein [Xylaria sp. CBS 124048]|nr:cation transport protein-domain-containing protein [Xylaria sp. CBS 124048]